MNILHWIFSLIKPEGKVTWLSSNFSRWEDTHLKKKNERFRKNSEHFPVIFFEVPGAGDISMSESCHHRTAKVVGFSFGVEWGIYGFCGGVIGRKEAKKMAEFILQKCSLVTETEEEEISRIKQSRTTRPPSYPK